MHRLKKRKYRVVVTLSCIAILCLATVSVAQVVFNGCLWWACAPQRSFTVYDLELPSKYFPSEAELHTLHPLRGSSPAVEAVATTDYWHDGSAIYVVQRFATDSIASQDYEHITPFRFTEPIDTSRFYPALAQWKSRFADQESIECGYVLQALRCVYVARYAEFTVLFNRSVATEGSSNTDFLDAVKYIDERFRDLLG